MCAGAADLRYQPGVCLAVTARQEPADDPRKRSPFASAGSTGPHPPRGRADMLPDRRRLRAGGRLYRTIALSRWLYCRRAAGADWAGWVDLAGTDLPGRCTKGRLTLSAFARINFRTFQTRSD